MNATSTFYDHLPMEVCINEHPGHRFITFKETHPLRQKSSRRVGAGEFGKVNALSYPMTGCSDERVSVPQLSTDLFSIGIKVESL